MVNKYLEKLLERYPELSVVKEDIIKTFELLIKVFEDDGTLFVCGNGGSAADSEHIVGELMKGFLLKREVDSSIRTRLESEYGEKGSKIADNLQMGLRSVSLTGHPALSSAYINDVDGKMVFAQQLFVMGREDDVLMGISTSGNAENVFNAVMVAKAKNIKTIILTGEDGGICGKHGDCVIRVPAKETYCIQEYHLPVYHTLCMMIEDYFYGKRD